MFGLSLCAGAGGLDLGLHLAVPRYRTVGYVERESYAAATLVARMEDAALDRAPVWDDVASFDGRPWRGLVDIVHGGYPCQPFSIAGRKLGDKDPRHLWPHVARIVREVKPPVCFFENVGGHLRLGFEQVHDDLRAMGYRVKAGLFTAAEVGAPHKRERLFILAYAESAGDEREAGNIPAAHGGSDGSLFRFTDGSDSRMADAARLLGKKIKRHEPDGNCGGLGNADHARLEGRDSDRRRKDELPAWPPGPSDHENWEHVPAHLEPAVCRMVNGLAHRVDRLRLCGNGVVPLVAAYAFRTLAAAGGVQE